jgi:hypothetical protein
MGTCFGRRKPFIMCLVLQATAAYEEAREKVARLINARSSREIVFMSNASAGLNLVAHSWGRANLGPGDEVCPTPFCFVPGLCIEYGSSLPSLRPFIYRTKML